MRSRLEKSWRVLLGVPLSMSPVAGRWYGWTLTAIYHHSFLNSGSVSIDDTEYRWKSKGTGTKVVVRQSYLQSPSKKAQLRLSVSSAGKQRYQCNGRPIPQSQRKRHIQKTSRYEPRNLSSCMPRGGYCATHVSTCMEREAKREEESFGHVYDILMRAIPEGLRP